MLFKAPSATWHHWLQPDEVELRDVWHIIERTQRCILVTHSPDGERHARALRLQNHSRGRADSLWLCVPRASTAAGDVRRNTFVSIEIDDGPSERTVRLTGRATLMEHRPCPAVLHPSVADGVKVVTDDIDFALMRIDIDDINVEHWDSAPMPLN